VVFQEGINFFDGGWFDTLTVQVRQNGVWTNVANLVSTPPYPPNDAVNYETYTLTFDDTVGDGIRIDGAPGGSADFISVGELEVYGESAGPIPTLTGPTPTPTTTPLDLTQLGAIAAAVTRPTRGGHKN